MKFYKKMTNLFFKAPLQTENLVPYSVLIAQADNIEVGAGSGGCREIRYKSHCGRGAIPVANIVAVAASYQNRSSSRPTIRYGVFFLTAGIAPR